ncbi:MAG: hypothetical protein ABIR70_10255 [Bryobacteraceae bacterium]
MGQRLTEQHPGRTQQSPICDPGPLHIFVLDGANTAAAISAARTLARGLNAELTLLAAVEVPLPLNLDEPPVSIAFQENRLRELLARNDASGRVDLVLCRDKSTAIVQALPPESIVVLADPKRWFGTAHKLAKTLSRQGHKVFFAEQVKPS